MRSGEQSNNRKRGSNKGILKARRDLRRTQAELRAIARAARSNVEQLQRALERPGESARERKRLS